MYGWEFPPNNAGGLGTACHGLTKGLVEQGTDVTFVLPTGEDINNSHIKVIITDKKTKNNQKLNLKKINSPIKGYMTEKEYAEKIKEYVTNGRKLTKRSSIYGENLYLEVERYAQNSLDTALSTEFDIIHAHDWLTYKAGIIAKKATGKPLIVHIHATEFDRCGGEGINQKIYEIEKEGFNEANKILSVSQLTKKRLIKSYGINPNKIEVVHNAVEFNEESFKKENRKSKLNEKEKIVLFLGRITIQKGPDYFLYAAKKVLGKEPNTKFIIAGNGDMEHYIIEKAAELGIGNKILFTGFLRGKEIDQVYQMADLYVMPSVSEPFGITPLESMRNETPVLISKQSGVSEVINHALKVDFWDINQMANKILGVINYKALQESLIENAITEVKKFDWKKPAKKCISEYNKLLR